MPPALVKTCPRCRHAGVLYFVDNEMMCQACAARPPKHAYFGTVFALSALAFVVITAAGFGFNTALEFYFAEQDRKTPPRPPVSKQRPMEP